jgi:hypothetical protein
VFAALLHSSGLPPPISAVRPASAMDASLLSSQHPLRDLHQGLSADDGMIRHRRWQPPHLRSVLTA